MPVTMTSHEHQWIYSYITCNSTVFSTVCLILQQRKHQSSTLLALCEGNPPVIPTQMASGVESMHMQGSFCVCAQPMSDEVAL